MTNNLARAFGGNTINTSFHDLVNPPEEDTRTEEDVINTIQQKLKEVE